MALALILIGLLIWLVLSPFIGIVLVIVGIILLFVPAVPYGYSSWRGRRPPP
jgi:hypothetical protein